MKRVICALLLTLTMCGCADTTELGDRAIIQLAAIDFQDGEYLLNALLFSAGGSGGELDVSQTNVIKVTGRGKTVGEAVQSLSFADGKDIYMSEAKLIVLGSGFSGCDIPPVLNMLYRDMRCSLNTPICCAENAELLTDMEFTEGITAAEKPMDMIQNGYLMGVSPSATLLDVISDYNGGRQTLVPYFSETENGRGMTLDDDGKTAEISGSQVISGGRLGRLGDMWQTAGAMLLSGKSDSVQLSIVIDGEELTCEAYRIKASLKNGKPQAQAYFRTVSGEGLSPEQEKAAQKRLLQILDAGMEYAFS